MAREPCSDPLAMLRDGACVADPRVLSSSIRCSRTAILHGLLCRYFRHGSQTCQFSLETMERIHTLGYLRLHANTMSQDHSQHSLRAWTVAAKRGSVT